MPDVATAVTRLEPRVERAAAAVEAARELDLAELELALSSTPRERRAAWASWLEARHELRALAREPGGTR